MERGERAGSHRVREHCRQETRPWSTGESKLFAPIVIMVNF